MFRRIRIEAEAQRIEDVSADLWEMAYLIEYALVGKDQPAASPHVHEEVIERLADTERTDRAVYGGRLVIGYPVDWDHAKGWFEIQASARGKVVMVDYPPHGQLSPALQEELLAKWRDEGGHPTSPDAVAFDTEPGECDHPPDAVMWNPWNEALQCHRCGTQMTATPIS